MKAIFPSEFQWGVSTSAYQIEGAPNSGGKGASIWDVFSHTSGKTNNNENGDIACDHYHRYLEDIKIMKDMGIKSSRFSIAWTRIFPEGRGKPNPAGLDFYKRLIDGLLQNDIIPTATLYHWDLPHALQEKGGWLNRDTVNYFVDYAQYMFSELDDVVPLWITHNEPWVIAYLGYGFGYFAPGISDLATAVEVAHHLLLSHGKAVQAFRALSSKGDIGITLNLYPAYSASDKAEDLAATELYHQFANTWFLNPVLLGSYPEKLWEKYQREYKAPTLLAGDMESICSPIDFLGINYYSRFVAAANTKSHNSSQHFLLTEIQDASPQNATRTDMDWEVYPDGLYDLLMQVHRDYPQLPLYIMENGAAFADKLKDDAVHDPDRVDYLRGHISALHRAIADGVSLKGYYVWSLLDNFEWVAGYSKRFGLIYVDYSTLKRIWKDSARYYQKVIHDNGII